MAATSVSPYNIINFFVWLALDMIPKAENNLFAPCTK